MGTVATVNRPRATAYGNQRRIDRCQNGVLWAIRSDYPDAAYSDVYAAYSTDNGATWTNAGQINSKTVDNIEADASLFIDVDDYAHVAYKHSSTGYIVYTRGTPNAGRTAWTWSAATALTSTGAYDHPDIVAFRDPATSGAWVAYAVWADTTNTTVKVRGSRININSGGTVTVAGTDNIAAALAAANASSSYPSIDFNHTGDGKTVAGGTPHLYVGWSAGATGSGYGIRFRKASYSGGSYTWGTEREIDTAHYVNDTARWLNCFFDGTRVVIAGFVYTGSVSDVIVHDRDASDPATGGTTTRTVLTSTVAADRLWSGSSTYDTAGNVFLFGADTTGANGSRKVNSRRWVRATQALDAVVTIDATGADQPFVSARRGPQGGFIDYVYTDGTASPYTVTSGRILLNTAPTAATPTTPTTGSAVDRTQPITLAWVFNDPDAGDSQSKADVRYKLTSASTWTTILGATTTGTSYALPANQTAGDYEWQVLTYDAQGVASPWSTSSFFTAANPPQTPTITAPSTGGTVSTASYTVTWSAPQQDAYEVRRVADNAGSPNTATVYSTTGLVTDATSRARTLAFDTNNRNEHVQIRVTFQGITSAWASARILVSYTPPPAPVVQLVVRNDISALEVRVTNPTSSGSQPAVASNSVEVDDGYGEGFTARATSVAPNGVWTYAFPRINYDYEQKVRVTAVGANGTSSSALAPVTT